MSMHGEMYGRLLKCGASALFQEARSRFTGGGNYGTRLKLAESNGGYLDFFFGRGPVLLR